MQSATVSSIQSLCSKWAGQWQYWSNLQYIIDVVINWWRTAGVLTFRAVSPEPRLTLFISTSIFSHTGTPYFAKRNMTKQISCSGEQLRQISTDELSTVLVFIHRFCFHCDGTATNNLHCHICTFAPLVLSFWWHKLFQLVLYLIYSLFCLHLLFFFLYLQPSPFILLSLFHTNTHTVPLSAPSLNLTAWQIRSHHLIWIVNGIFNESQRDSE